MYMLITVHNRIFNNLATAHKPNSTTTTTTTTAYRPNGGLQRDFYEDVTYQHPLFVNYSTYFHYLQITQATIELCLPNIL